MKKSFSIPTKDGLIIDITINFGEMTLARAIEWVDKAIEENAANEGRAWVLYELGESQGRNYCNIPDSEAVGFGNDILREIRSQLIDMLGNEEEDVA